ncbi:hypothetical protein DNU06_07520 [Putridiphycobacter roseus]|uniref:PPM-type phosphatase domain-containing protein n=1 Tax=Putridiphycobacter roseus TaxID=2219161 RepID=A0A2W1N2B4_9FLAO|nr:tetratricopeptide repeat protein [Putridiphycobacter roseus]PZE17670.1 hypothetical protein DNU06_07520 [Putridiphycobacter roseus]
MYKYFVLLGVLLLFPWKQLLATEDSLIKVWENPKNHDTLRFEAYKNYIWETYMFTNPDTALVLSKELYDLAEKKAISKYMVAALNHQAVAYSILGQTDQSLVLYAQSLSLAMENHNEIGAGVIYSNMGVIYTDRGAYKEAAENYFKALKIFEKKKDITRIGRLYNNLGVLYNSQKIYHLAIKYYEESLKIKETLKDPKEIGGAYLNLGAVYGNLKESEKAKTYYEQAYFYLKKAKDLVGLGNYYLNIGQLYDKSGEYNKSLNSYLRALELFTQVNDVVKITMTEIYLGGNYNKLEEKDLALMHLVSGIEKAKQYQVQSMEMIAAQELYLVFDKAQDYEKALTYLDLYHQIKDSLNSAKNQEAALNMKYQHEYDKKAIMDSLEFARIQGLNILEIEEQKAALAKARTQQIAMYGGIVLLLGLGLVMYRSYRTKKKAHDIINKQHQLLAQTHQEIKESIDYAKRLQNTILPNDLTLLEHFPNHFVLFKPKDVVSGDFYWFEYIKEKDLRIVAVADCTGHGVPGAMVSLVCATALNRSVNELGISDPGLILDMTRKLIIETFTKRKQYLRDGMDITICCLDANNLCAYSGASNSLWHFSKKAFDQRNESALTEHRVDKHSVGWTETLKPFKTQTIQLGSGDYIYLQTDGFVDQFGGPKNKKFKKKPLKEYLLSITTRDPLTQKELLLQKFNNWKGSEEQVDDVCMMGIKV